MSYKKKTAMMVGALLCLNGSLYAQSISLNVNNVSVKKATAELQNKSGYSFVYLTGDLDTNKNVSVNASNVEDAVNQILAGQNVTYEIKGKKIIIKKIEYQKQSDHKKKIIRGNVTDATGEPIIGANIFVKGDNTNGTVTDINGNFELNAPSDGTLVVSYIGYLQNEVKVASAKSFNIKLKEDSKNLDEVVVVGYGTQKKVNLTGSVSSVTAAEIASKPVMSTSQALAGLAPGLSVMTNSGNPGAGASVRIRGTGTFSSAGNSPLVLIDGLSGNIDDVDPNDIQSISFLKDAASASIYGNRAANGVVLIETKKGSEGKTSISYNGSIGWQKVTEMPDFLPSWEYATYYNMAMRNMGRQEAYSSEQIQKYKDGSDPDNYPNANHLKWLMESGSGFQHQHNVSIQGGNSKTSYNVSIGYRNQEGMTARTNNERMTALVSLKSEIAKNLVMNINLSGYNNKYNAPNGSGSISSIIGYSVREPSIYAGKKSDGSYGYQDNYSPEAWLDSESFVQNIGRNVRATGQLSWNTPIKGLSLVGKAGVSYWTGYDKSYVSKTIFDKDKTVGPSSLSINSSNNTYTTFDAMATYEKNISDHFFKIMAGTSLERACNRGLYGYRNTFPNNYLYELSSGDKSSANNSSDLSEYALLSYFGRINYSYKDRYLVEGNMRYDGSSRFAPNNRWGFFPSVSVGWRLSEEDFWKNSKISEIVDNLKFRASYGVLGNQNIGTYPYQQTYALGSDYIFGGTLLSGAYLPTYKNQNITWEKTAITDFGLDFSILNGTITGTVDYFYKYTSDILSSVEVTGIMGRGVGESNVGAVSNKGIELMLSYNGKIGNDFRFSISPNFTWVKNAVEELSNGAKEEINNNRIVGQPLGIIYGYETDGLFVDQNEIDNAPDQLVGKSSLKPGYVKYKDISGPNGVPDGKVDATYDRKVLGSTTPKYYYGLNLSASYKGFDFSALMQGLGGHKRLIGSYMAYAFYNGGQIQRWQADNCWTVENPNKWAEYPRIETLNMNHPNLQTSDYWIRNASFLRVKNVQLGYTLPKSMTSRIGVSQLRVYVSGQNLFNFNSFYKGWDPENEIGTGDSPYYYPLNAIYSFGVNLKF